MIRLQTHEELIGSFRVKKSQHGKGMLYVTNQGLHFETEKYGVVFAVPYSWMSSYHASKKNKLVTVWVDPHTGRKYYDYKVDSANEIVQTLARQSSNYNDKLIEYQKSQTAHKKFTDGKVQE